MRILMVSPYPPIHDGIGAYAVQQAMTLRRKGHDVEVLSPVPSAAHHHLELRGWRGPLALAKRTPLYDRVIVHFHVDMFYPAPLTKPEWVAVTTGLFTAFTRARSLDLVIHEINYDWGRRRSTRRMTNAMLRAATRIMVHTQTEKRLLCDAFTLPSSAVTVVDHGSAFVRRTSATTAEARHALDVPDDAFVFLAIGFVQPHKGFDRAIRAFNGLGERGCRLYIVGSVRVEEPEYVAHLAELRELAAATPGVELRIDYVSDERFDEWLVAADLVVLPYRYIWSSGVLERARLYDRAVIAADVGGLRDQGHGKVTWFSSDDELVSAMHAAALGGDPSGLALLTDVEPFVVAPDTSRGTVMAMVRERAAARRRAPGARTAATTSPRVAALLRVAPLQPPSQASRSRLHRAVKRTVDRLIRWQTEPLRVQVNAVRDATLQVAEEMAAQSVDDHRTPGSPE